MQAVFGCDLGVACWVQQVVITTPEKWDGISRHWQHRSYVRRVGLVVIDEIHLLGQDRGPVLEVLCTIEAKALHT
eukprot:4220855-Amphidinium_carterae.2